MAPSEVADSGIERRTFLRRAGAVGLVVAGASTLGDWAGVAGARVLDAPPPNDTAADPDAALARLMRGNRRFVRGKPKNPFDSDERRRASVGTQTPFAAVLACSDFAPSRPRSSSTRASATSSSSASQGTSTAPTRALPSPTQWSTSAST